MRKTTIVIAFAAMLSVTAWGQGKQKAPCLTDSQVISISSDVFALENQMEHFLALEDKYVDMAYAAKAHRDIESGKKYALQADAYLVQAGKTQQEADDLNKRLQASLGSCKVKTHKNVFAKMLAGALVGAARGAAQPTFASGAAAGAGYPPQHPSYVTMNVLFGASPHVWTRVGNGYWYDEATNVEYLQGATIGNATTYTSMNGKTVVTITSY